MFSRAATQPPASQLAMVHASRFMAHPQTAMADQYIAKVFVYNKPSNCKYEVFTGRPKVSSSEWHFGV